MIKRILLMLFSCTFTLILFACSQTEEDTEEYSGIISNEQAMDYEYTLLKEQNKFTWKVGYNGDISIIEESDANHDDLVNYMNAVNDSKLVLVKLILSVSYLLIISITTFILYKKDRKKLKGGGIVITMLSGIALYIAFKSSFDLIRLLQDTKYFYLLLTS